MNDEGTEPSGRRRPQLRPVFTTLLAILTGIAMLAATLAVWVDRTLLDTDEWVATVGPLAADPAVQQAVADAITTQLFNAVDVEAKVEAVLPDAADALAAPLTATVEGWVADGVVAVLASDEFQQVWIAVNRVAHENAVALVRGETIAGISADEGQVSLNLLPLISRVLVFVDEHAPGWLTDDRPVPDITPDTPPDEARAELSAALGVQLPDDFGVIDLYDSQQLAAAQRIVELLDRLAIALPVLALALGVATVFSARRRRRALVVLGIAVASFVALASALTRALTNHILDLVSSEENRRALANVLSAVIDDLRAVAILIVIAGVALAVAGFVTGDSRPARAIQRLVDGAVDRSSTIRRNLDLARTGLAIAGVAGLVLWLLIGDPTWATLLVAAAVFSLFEAALALVPTSSS